MKGRVGVILFGMLWVIVAGISIWSDLGAELRSDAKVEGTCVAVKENTRRVHRKKGGSYNQKIYAPVVEFEVEGVTYSVTSSHSETYYKNSVGKTFTVVYMSDNPMVCDVQPKWFEFVPRVIAILVGVFLIVCGVRNKA